MKKIYAILAISALISSTVLAQPTITSGMFYSAGSSVTTDEVSNAASLTPGSAGANQTWNFSTAIPDGSPVTSTYTSVAGTPYAANFPGSNLAFTTVTNGAPSYAYLTHGATETVINGFGFTDTGSGTTIIWNYSNPMTQMVYPATYNTNMTDTYASSYSFTDMGFTITSYSSGSTTAVIDGYGTLTTPTGTYTNVLRIRSHNESTDSTVFSGPAPIPASVSNSNGTTYTYVQVVGGKAVDRFSLSYDTVTTQFGTNTFVYGSMTTGTTVGLFTPTAENINAIAYPNPASDMTYIDLPSVKNTEVNVELYDYSGRLLHSDAMIPQQGRIELPVSMLTAGMYMVRVNQDEKYWSGSVIKN